MFKRRGSLRRCLELVLHWCPHCEVHPHCCQESCAWQCPSDSVALRTRVPSCPEHPHTSFTLGGAGGAARSKKAEDIWTAHTNPLQNLQLLLSTCSLLTACLMRNKLLHKQAKNTSKRENRKAWETKARRWTSRAHGKWDLSPWRVIANEGPNRSRFLCMDCRNSHSRERFPHTLLLALTPEQPQSTESV